MRISIDADDFSPLNHRFDLLEELRKRYPTFKITMFTIPWDIRINPQDKGTPITLKKFKPWVNEVKKGIEEGWLDISLHGFTHGPREFENLSYDQAQKKIIVAEKMFDNVGIKLSKMFKAPYWLLSEKAELALTDMGYTVVKDGYYSWNIKDTIPKGDLILAHGHVHDTCGNGLEESLARVMETPIDAEWIFLKEVYEHHRIQ